MRDLPAPVRVSRTGIGDVGRIRMLRMVKHVRISLVKVVS